MRGRRRGALVALLALAVALGVRAALDRAGTAGDGDGGQAQVQAQPTGADAGGDAEPGTGDDGTTGRVMGHADQDTYLGWDADLSWLGGGGAS